LFDYGGTDEFDNADIAGKTPHDHRRENRTLLGLDKHKLGTTDFAFNLLFLEYQRALPLGWLGGAEEIRAAKYQTA